MENTKPKITLQALYSLFDSNPEGKWIIEGSNAVELYNWVKKHPVKRILDLGTGIGCSASIMALALLDKGETDFHIDSMEQFDKCIKIANQLIPEELKKHITIHKSDAGLWQTDKIPYQYFSVYKTLPEAPESGWDLVVNDGPSPILIKNDNLFALWQGEHYIDMPNGTIMKLLLEKKLKAGTTIIYDGRYTSLKMLERYFYDNFTTLKVPLQGSDFNVFERKDGAVVFKDRLLEEMRTLTPYFSEYKENEKSL